MSKGLAPLPPLPRAVNLREAAIPAPVHEVEPRSGDMSEAEPGRWFETGQAQDSIGGTCCRCGSRKPARKLRYFIGPFGRWEGWACGACRSERGGVEKTIQVRAMKRPQLPGARPVPQGEAERIYWAGVRKLERDEVDTWEDEGGR